REPAFEQVRDHRCGLNCGQLAHGDCTDRDLLKFSKTLQPPHHLIGNVAQIQGLHVSTCYLEHDRYFKRSARESPSRLTIPLSKHQNRCTKVNFPIHRYHHEAATPRAPRLGCRRPDGTRDSQSSYSCPGSAGSWCA